MLTNVCRICTCWWVFIPFEHVDECLIHLYMLTNACPIRIYWGLFRLRDTPVRKLGKTLSRMATRKSRVKDQASHLRKQQTARPHSVHWWLSHQRPVRVGLHCQGRCDHYPWRQCSLYGLNRQLDNGGGSSHPYPLLDCLKGWQSDHTCHHPHRFNELAKIKWNGKPRLECVDGRHPPLKTPVGVLPWTCRS